MEFKTVVLAGAVLATTTIGTVAPAFAATHAASQAVPRPPEPRETTTVIFPGGGGGGPAEDTLLGLSEFALAGETEVPATDEAATATALSGTAVPGGIEGIAGIAPAGVDIPEEGTSVVSSAFGQ